MLREGRLRGFQSLLNELQTESENTYAVDQTVNDETYGDEILRTWACSCPAGQHGRMCKHVRAVIELVDGDESEL